MDLEYDGEPVDEMDVDGFTDVFEELLDEYKNRFDEANPDAEHPKLQIAHSLANSVFMYFLDDYADQVFILETMKNEVFERLQKESLKAMAKRLFTSDEGDS